VVANPTIAAGAFAQLGPIIQALDIDFDALLARVDLKPNDLDDPDARISLVSVAELLENVAGQIGNDAFGLELAQKYPAGSAGILGYAVLNAPTVREMLQDIARYTRIVTPQQRSEFTERDGRAEITWEFPDALDGTGDQYKAIITSMLVRRVRRAAGDDWRPLQAVLSIDLPDAVEAYRAVFGEDLRFGAARSRVVISQDTLDLEMPDSDRRLHKLIRELGEYRLNEIEAKSDIVDRTQDQIIELLSKGPVSLEQVARSLGQSARSLQRRLQEEGTSFQNVMEKTRRLLARHYLRTRKHTLTEIAYLLGFSEQSAFTRACKRWFNATPVEMRNRLRMV